MIPNPRARSAPFSLSMPTWGNSLVRAEPGTRRVRVSEVPPGSHEAAPPGPWPPGRRVCQICASAAKVPRPRDGTKTAEANREYPSPIVNTGSSFAVRGLAKADREADVGERESRTGAISPARYTVRPAGSGGSTLRPQLRHPATQSADPRRASRVRTAIDRRDRSQTAPRIRGPDASTCALRRRPLRPWAPWSSFTCRRQSTDQEEASTAAKYRQRRRVSMGPYASVLGQVDFRLAEAPRRMLRGVRDDAAE